MAHQHRDREPPPGTDLQELAKRHLWMHFTRMGAYADAEVPIIVRGEGPYVYDEHGNRYLDGLSALFCSTPATAAPRSARRRPARSRSSTSSRCGATPTRARSSWPRGSRR